MFLQQHQNAGFGGASRYPVRGNRPGILPLAGILPTSMISLNGASSICSKIDLWMHQNIFDAGINAHTLQNACKR
jgi:hypothetical protein